MNINDGIWVTMITTFDSDNKIDYDAVGKIVEWYIKSGVDGIFSVCQSSEMFFLSREERLSLAEFVIKKVAKRTGVVVSGIIEETLDEQIKTAKMMAALTPDAIVFLSNMVGYKSGDFYSDIDIIIKELPENINLGMYECPYPFKKLLSSDEIKYLINTNRFKFLKDTSCDTELIIKRNQVAKNTGFKIFNANSATLYDSVICGYNGYCGVMANFHPDLYAWLYKNIKSDKALKVEKYLGMMSLIETRGYPMCAKIYLKEFENFNISPHTRSLDYIPVSALHNELRDLYSISEELRELIV